MMPDLLPIRAVMAANPHCAAGLFSVPQVFSIELGLSGGREVLALLTGAEEPYFGYWYGFISLYKQRGSSYASLIVRSKKFIDGITIEALFTNFFTWMVYFQEYEYCKTQSFSDVFAISDSFQDAVTSLAAMIQRFDINKRFPNQDSPLYSSLVDFRILEALSVQRYQGA